MSQQAEPINEREGLDLLPLLQGFVANRQLTYDLLDSLSETDLVQIWPRPGLDSFSKQFQEMAAVQVAFLDALNSGVMDFSAVPDVHAFADLRDKEALRKLLHDADQKFQNAITKRVKSSVRWDDINIPTEGHLVNLISHEVFHQGQMVMALYTLQLSIPDSWINNWAVPQTSIRPHR